MDETGKQPKSVRVTYKDGSVDEIAGNFLLLRITEHIEEFAIDIDSKFNLPVAIIAAALLQLNRQMGEELSRTLIAGIIREEHKN